MSDFLFIKPFFALILTGLSSAIIGVFVLWKRLSYFGDAISHSILLGAALAAIFNLSQNILLIFIAISFAMLVAATIENRYFSKDVVIAAMSYICVALAIVINSLQDANLDFSDYIFGNILAVQNSDLIILSIISICLIVFTKIAFKKILLMNLSQDLAKIDGINTNFWHYFFLILLALTIAITAKIIGILLITALLVLPAAIARIFSNSALQMIITSVAISLFVSILFGFIALNFNIPAEAFIILVLGIIFIFSLFVKNVS